MRALAVNLIASWWMSSLVGRSFNVFHIVGVWSAAIVVLLVLLFWLFSFHSTSLITLRLTLSVSEGSQTCLWNPSSNTPLLALTQWSFISETEQKGNVMWRWSIHYRPPTTGSFRAQRGSRNFSFFLSPVLPALLPVIHFYSNKQQKKELSRFWHRGFVKQSRS